MHLSKLIYHINLCIEDREVAEEIKKLLNENVRLTKLEERVKEFKEKINYIQSSKIARECLKPKIVCEIVNKPEPVNDLNQPYVLEPVEYRRLSLEDLIDRI